MSFINNVIEKDSPYYFIISLIPEGEENAVSMNTLSSLLNIEDRDVRQLILSARKEGFIIASSQRGYFIPKDREELQNYYVATQRRVRTTAISVSAVKRKLNSTGEEGLSGEEGVN